MQPSNRRKAAVRSTGSTRRITLSLPGKNCSVWESVAFEPMRPALSIHSEARFVTPRIMEPPVKMKRAGMGIEVDHKQAMLTIFSRIHHDTAPHRVRGYPV